MQSFSQRNGFIDSQILQKDNISYDLKLSLFNVIVMCLEVDLKNEKEDSYSQPNKYKTLIYIIYLEFFKGRVTSHMFKNAHSWKIIEFIESEFFNLEFFEVYDFLEIIISKFKNKYADDSYIKVSMKFNDSLKKHNSAYRVVEGSVVSITSEDEINEIERAAAQDAFIQEHLNKAIYHMSNKDGPDYRNSIKESISAVEYCVREITRENTLGDAFKKLEKNNIIIPEMLRCSFLKLYHWTNDKKSGVRHALMEEGKMPKLEEARYMLITSSAFINYLKEKQL